MHRSRIIPTALAVAIGLYGCGGASDPAPDFSDSNDIPEGRVAPVFDAAAGEFPIPNDILFSLQATKQAAGTAESDLPASEQENVDGTMFASYDPDNPVFVGIDHMDGASTLAHIDLKISGSLDGDQTLDARPFIVSQQTGAVPNPGQNVFLLPLRYAGGDSVSTTGATTADASDNETPTLQPAYDYGQFLGLLSLFNAVQAGQATQDQTNLFNALGGAQAVQDGVAEWAQVANNPEARAEIISLDGGTNNAIRVTPLQPLEARTKYLVVLGKNITTAAGEPLAESVFYELVSDETDQVQSSLASVQAAVRGWEQLANGWFGFVEQAYSGLGNPIDFDPGIALSYTFTTTDPQAVLKYIAAPSTFFNDAGTVSAKQDAVSSVLSGTFVVVDADGDTTDIFFGQIPGGQETCANPPAELAEACQDAAVAVAVNNQLLAQLTDPTWEYYSPALAQAYGTAAAGGATSYAALLAAAGSSASSLAHYIQLSAAEAALNAQVPQGGGATFAQFIQQTATNTANGQLSALLPQPASRADTASFSLSGCLGTEVNGCATENAFSNAAGISLLYEGQIELPYYLATPDGTNPTPLLGESWEADETLYNAISAGLEQLGQDALPDFPSDKVTYRIPFPAKKDDVIVPVVTVLPSETAIQAFTAATPDGGADDCTAGVDCKPANGWPVIIFQHGITANRTNALPLGHALANGCFSEGECFATIAIDQPLHGIAPNSANVNNLSAVGSFGQNDSLQERHFYFTATGNGVGQITAESGTSGSLFQNLTSFPTGRDNLRQGSVDLMNLLASLGDMDVDGLENGPDFDTSRVYFIGHSLGAINGVPFLSVNNMTADATGQPKVKASAVLNSGGFLTQLLLNSPSPAFGAPRILAGLAAEGVTQGSIDLEIFMRVLQGLLDSADSMNFAESLGEGDSSVLLTEIVGGDPVNVYPGERFVDPLPAGGAICTDADTEQEGCVTQVTPSDQTIPNAADQEVWGVAPLSNDYDAPGSGKNAGDPWMINGQAISITPVSGTPLAGTEPMASLMGAEKTVEASNDPLISVTRFTRGDHANPVAAGTTESVDADGNPIVGNKFSSERVFSEMALQIGSLFATARDGSTPSVTVNDGCVIEDSDNNDRSDTSSCPLGEFQAAAQ